MIVTTEWLGRAETHQQDAGDDTVRRGVLLARLAPGEPRVVHRERRST